MMLKKIYLGFKKVVFGFFFLYAYNVISSPLNCIIPINFITVGTLSIFGIPSFFSFVLIKLLLF